MINIVIGLISFVAIFGGVVFGMVAARRLPGHHLSSETQSAVTVSVAVIGTLSALVLGLMISAANSSFLAPAEKEMLAAEIIKPRKRADKVPMTGTDTVKIGRAHV